MSIASQFKKILVLVFFLQIFSLAMPSPALALPKGLVSIVPDECYGKPTQGADGRVSITCGWDQLIQMGQNILNDSIYIAAMLAVFSIVWAGWKYMSSGDSSSGKDEAKKILWKVVQGIFFTMAAWLIISTILKFLGVSSAFSLLG